MHKVYNIGSQSFHPNKYFHHEKAVVLVCRYHSSWHLLTHYHSSHITTTDNVPAHYRDFTDRSCDQCTMSIIRKKHALASANLATWSQFLVPRFCSLCKYWRLLQSNDMNLKVIHMTSQGQKFTSVEPLRSSQVPVDSWQSKWSQTDWRREQRTNHIAPSRSCPTMAW